MKQLILGLMTLALLSSCVAKKKFLAMQSQRDSLQNALNMCKKSLAECDDAKTKLMSDLDGKTKDLDMKTKDLDAAKSSLKSANDQIDYLKKSNTNLLQRLQDLSIISQAGAESIKKSLDALNEKDKTIKNLTSASAKKDSMNVTLVMNLKRSLGDEMNSKDIQIDVKKGVIFISLSDKMLFQSGSAAINPAAQSVLAKVAKVLNDHKNLDIMVEGHTDNVPFGKNSAGNWDLSTKRANSVVKTLQSKYKVAPERMTAAGKSQYEPKADNKSKDGKKQNRRTEIILTPQLDQFFEMMTPAMKK